MPITLSWSSRRSELFGPVPHTFCDDCVNLLTAPESLATVGLKFSYAALEKSIADGCRLCYLFHQAWLEKLLVAPGSMVGDTGWQPWKANEIVRFAKSEKAKYFEHMFSASINDVQGKEGWNGYGDSRGADIPRTDIEHVVFQCNLPSDPGDAIGCSLHYSIGFVFVLVEGEAPKIAGRVIPKHANLGLAQQWIEHCAKTHLGCVRSFNGELPKRIIDVGRKEDPMRPRLVANLDDSYNEYVALSHCWGECQPLVTTSFNYEDHLRSIEWTALPRSFQHAIEVTRTLGYRYLWIDSLCILQDDAEDWRKECPKMVSIYSNATVTIAAAGAKDAFEGFLHTRTAKDQSDLIYLQQPNGCGIAKIAVTPLMRPYSNDSYRRAEKPAVLANRAWAFQERLLSCRILYFGSEQMYFECNAGFFCESIRFPLQTEMDEIDSLRDLRTRLTTDDIDRRRLLREWYWTVQQYSSLRLTHAYDRLPALAGLARLVQDRLGYEYYEGLWMEDICIGLGWIRDDVHSHNRTSKDGFGRGTDEFPGHTAFPSWSWASCNYPVLTRHRDAFDSAPHSDFQVTASSSNISDGCHETLNGRLSIRARIATAVLTHDMLQNETNFQPPHEKARLERLCLDHRYKAPYNLSKYEKAQKRHITKPIECLLLSEDSGGFQTILLLEAINDTPDRNLYRRCGAYHAFSCQWVGRAPVREVTIV